MDPEKSDSACREVGSSYPEITKITVDLPEKELIGICEVTGITKKGPAIRKLLATLLGGITENGVKYHLEKLKASGLIRRVGPDRGGHWEVTSGSADPGEPSGLFHCVTEN